MTHYSTKYLPDHPVATKRGYVKVHRYVLFEKIGPGRHKCNWCGTEVIWANSGGPRAGFLQADHVNGDPLDNRPENLVPSCHRCNTRRGNRNLVRDDELFIVGSSGFRQRAEMVNCEHCETPFVASIAQRKVGDARFCSPSCMYRRNKP